MVAFSPGFEVCAADRAPGDLAPPARVLAVCVSPGGIPKLPQPEGRVGFSGIAGDGRNHAKHVRPDRAVSLWDVEVLQQLVREGFPSLAPGVAGENLTVAGLCVQALSPGTLLAIGPVLLRLEQPRKPCYVLDAIDPRLKEAIVGRCGYLASVVREGVIRPGMEIEVVSADGAARAATTPGPAISGQESIASEHWPVAS
jgi:MOSC domain-containing protein YiiM